MIVKDFQDLLIELNNKEASILKSKGSEYSRSDDVLANFKRLAVIMDLSVLQVWGVYFMKHIDAIIYWIANGKSGSEETIQDRIMDARNYLALLHAIVKEPLDDFKPYHL